MSTHNSKKTSLHEVISNYLSSVPFDEWPDQFELAKLLSISTTTLRQRLMREGIRYQALKDELRFRRATQKMLGDKYLTIQNLAFEIGFAEERTFCRAFKKWSGYTPGVYRDLLKNCTTFDHSLAFTPINVLDQPVKSKQNRPITR